MCTAEDTPGIAIYHTACDSFCSPNSTTCRRGIEKTALPAMAPHRKYDARHNRIVRPNLTNGKHSSITSGPAPSSELKPGESILTTSSSTKKDNVVSEIIKIAKIVTVTPEANAERDLHLRRHLHHRHGKRGSR